MKKIMLLLVTALILASCADDKTIDGKTYRPYGLLNENTARNDSVQYEISGIAVVSGVLFFETIVVPIYVFGYNLWEPVGKKADNSQDKGVIK